MKNRDRRMDLRDEEFELYEDADDLEYQDTQSRIHRRAARDAQQELNPRRQPKKRHREWQKRNSEL